ncbi:MAG TPA: DNA polymerase III subunit gamma/tau [Chthoniobacteraceae bacterium]|nr:DNA polymerase III subunit gamma/tau [Chthoniobacteraceae bacterium]
MSYTVFARKYRPQTFDEIVGQGHIVRTLKNAIEQNRLAQAYLFVGPRGTGKTSTARIFAKALNCVNAPTTNPCGVCDMCLEIAGGNSLNVLEFDAASNTQVDKIREIIIDTVKYAPAHGRYKLYIVDEVHMLSTSSFNALLKTLEEPPAHVKFVFATTDVQKVPTTIISRCQRFDLRRIPTPEIAGHLLYIAGKEKITLDPIAAETIARGAEGGLRDAESMLDQLVAFCGEEIAEADVLNIFGFTSAQTVAALCEHLLTGDTAGALGVVHQQAEAGKDLSRLMADLISHLRNLLVIQCDPNGVKDELTPEAAAALAEQSGRIPMEKLLDLIEQFAGAESRMKWAPNKKMHFEIAVIRAIQTLNQATLTQVLDTLSAMREGGPLPATSPLPQRKPAPLPIAAKPKPERPAEVPSLPVAKRADPPSARASENQAPMSSATPIVAETSTPPSPSRAAAAPDVPSAASSPSEPPNTVSTPGELWGRFVARVRKERPLIQGWIEAGTLAEVQGDVAVLAFPGDQSLALDACQRPNNRGFLEATLSDLAGRPLTLKFVVRDGLVVEKIAQPEIKPPPPPEQAFKDDPLIKKALADFKAEIIPA